MRHQSHPKASGQRGTVVSLSVWSCAACHFRGGGSQSAAECYGARDLKSAILKRVAVEKQRREMDVYYYRIGYTMAFPLPLARRPGLKELPAALPKQAYPWLIWLSWDLEERWRLLATAWRRFGDHEAGALLQWELAALSGWDHFSEV